MAGITRKTINLIESILGIRSKAHKLYEERHVLVVRGLPEDTFNVVSFSSDGGLNRCYRAEALLTSRTPDVDLDQLLRAPVFAFSEGKRGSFITVRGHVAECEQQGACRDSYYYRVVLVPKLWFLTRTSHNQIFLNKTVVQILEELLLDGGLLLDEFEFRLTGSYDKVWEYVCQYNESHFDFFSRWLEREGLYFYLESNDDLDKLIITDSVQLHQPLQADHPLLFRPDSGLEFSKGASILNRFSVGCCQVPEKVTLKDYNYRHPTLDLTGSATIDTEGHGEVYLYGNHLQTPEESKRLAKVRAEAIACRKRIFSGSSNSFYLRPGTLFTVQDHFRQEYNSTYMVIDIRHEGHQPSLDHSRPDTVSAGEEKKPHYWNQFSAIPASAQYRALPSTARPRFHGMLNAVIDAAGPGQQPELDEQGRYKVQLPFDLSGKPGGKASAWLRMAQPYAGENHGMHFPLIKGTEVLLTFIDGDPDRPIIAAAVPNPLTPSRITDRNASLAGFSTPGGAQIVAQNMPGKEQVSLSQGECAHITVGGGKLDSYAGIEGYFTWQNAAATSMAIAKLFQFNYSCSSSVTCVGYKRDKLGYLSMFEVGAHNLGDLAEKHGGRFPYLQTTMAATALIVDFFATRQVKKIVSQRLKDKVAGAPQIGYGIMADATGATTYMKAPWSPSENRPDIAIVSSSGSINLVAQNTLYASADDKVVLAVPQRGQIIIGDHFVPPQPGVPTLSLSNNSLETVCKKTTKIIAGEKIRLAVGPPPLANKSFMEIQDSSYSATVGKSIFKVTKNDITFKGTKIRLG